MEHEAACRLDDQRMASCLGELPGARPEEPASPWAREFVKALVAEVTGLDSLLPVDCTWAQLAAEARSKVINQPGHLHAPGKWLDDKGEGYFTKWASHADLVSSPRR